MTDVGGVGDPMGYGSGVVQTGRFLADFDLEYRVNMIQAHFSEIFARCAHRQILKQIWINPGKCQALHKFLALLISVTRSGVSQDTHARVSAGKTRVYCHTPQLECPTTPPAVF